MGWSFFVDRGGTFTDLVARHPDGRVAIRKLLSADRRGDAAVVGIRALLGLGADAPVPAEAVETVRMGTTVATNALLERTGEPTVLVITAGFGDALRIGDQHRPRLFDRHIELPERLYGRVVEVGERVAHDGTVLRPLDLDGARAALAAAHDEGYRAAAIVCVHGYRWPEHEQQLAALARQLGFTQVSASHEVSPLHKLVPRGDTTVVDAYLSPGLRRYTDTVAAALGAVPLSFMQSSGGLAAPGRFRGKDAILSGPAGGIVAMARVAEAAGFDHAIGFDMGGTSTDVSLYTGRFERTFDTVVAGVRIQAPMLAIHTIAAGGGSILRFDGARSRVGPDSGGADPGPACYRRGGPATLTDANVVLGRIQAEHVPAVFGPAGDQPLDPDASWAALEALAQQMSTATGNTVAPEAAAEGFVEVAVANMVNAIKRISVRRGHDVSAYALVSFGGAGGQHACAVADALGIDVVVAHPLAGVLSAYGMGRADHRALAEHAVEGRLAEPQIAAVLAAALDTLAERVRADLVGEGADPASVSVERRVHLRYEGTDTALDVAAGSAAAMTAAFEEAYRQRFSFLAVERPLEVVAVAVEAVAPAATLTLPPLAGAAAGPAPSMGRAPLMAGGRRHDAVLHRREDLRPGHELTGPAVVVEPTATTVLDPGWGATVSPTGDLVLRRVSSRPARRAAGTEADPVLLEVFNGGFMAIAEQMGGRLAATAQSVNIKERLDFSCALFGPDGGLVANAPHMPVHLGSMGASVRYVLAVRAGELRPGDVIALNDPYHGGTHLPDVTVITPVFGDTGELWFVVASRGHHADIGGITPGSMPPASRTIDDEGVRFDNVLLVRDGKFREAEVLALLTSGPHPARNPQQNLGDLRAQIAANAEGVAEVLAMVGRFGLAVVQAYMGHVRANAEESVRRAIAALHDGECTYEMDNGAVIQVAVRVEAATRSATIDFTGTSAQLEDGFNAPAAVTTAAVLYVFRTLVDDEIPLNEGCLAPLRIVIPEGSVLNPHPPAAVVAGNVETSQCIVGALYRALGVMAEAQGTMNNVTFGDDHSQYYETVAGGSGAGPGFEGAACVQTHMTNSRLTDPEVLEARYPVVVESFAVRAGSGGRGRWRGGDGAVRRLRFTAPLTAAIVSGHRRIPPYGMAGGEPGAVGATRVERADGTVVDLGATGSTPVGPGDVLVVVTPGGGGYGPPDG